MKKRSCLFWEVVCFRAITTLTILIPYLIIALHSEYKEIFLIQTISVVAVLFDISWYFAGLEEFGVTVFRNTIVRLFSVAFIFIFVKSANDVGVYILGLASATFIGNITFWFLVPKYVSKISIYEIKPFRNVKIIIQLFIPYVATQIYSALDKVMIGHYTDTSFENGYYEQSEKIVKIALIIITTMGTVMVPRFAYLYKNEQWDQIKLYLKKGFSFVWLISIPLCLGLITVSDSFVPWFFGEDFLSVSLLLKIFSLLAIAIGLSNLLGTQYLIPTGRQNLYTISVVAGAAINVVLNLILIPNYLSIGAAIASVTAEGAIAVVQMIFLRKEIPIRLIFSTAKNYAIAGAFMFITTLLVSLKVRSSILGTLVIVLTGVISYTFILIVLKDPSLVQLIDLVKKEN